MSGKAVDFVEPGTGIAYPTGTRKMFVTYFGPAYHVATVNTPSPQVFITSEILKHGAGVELRAQSNPLPVCTRPELLVKVISN